MGFGVWGLGFSLGFRICGFGAHGLLAKRGSLAHAVLAWPSGCSTHAPEAYPRVDQLRPAMKRSWRAGVLLGWAGGAGHSGPNRSHEAVCSQDVPVARTATG